MKMPDALQQYQVVRGLIDSKPKAERDKIAACIRRIDQEVTDNGDLGLLALSMVSIMKQFSIDD